MAISFVNRHLFFMAALLATLVSSVGYYGSSKTTSTPCIFITQCIAFSAFNILLAAGNIPQLYSMG